MGRKLASVWCAVLAIGVGSAMGQEAGDEGTLSGLAAQPSPFSPGWSPKELDTTHFGFSLTRVMPVELYVLQNKDVVVKAVPAAAVANHVGWLPNRYEWDGRDDAGRPADAGNAARVGFEIVSKCLI